MALVLCMVGVLRAPSAPAAARHEHAMALIGASGTLLTLGGVPHLFVGLNAYELASVYGEVRSCGGQFSDTQLDAFFASLAPGTVVRFMAGEEDAAINLTTHQLDWAPLDRVFTAAAAHDIYLVPVLGFQSVGLCSSHWPDLSWYAGGYRQVFNSPTDSDGLGLNPLSYATYVADVVTRYANVPALGMWEPIAEAEPAECPAGDVLTGCWGHELCPNEALAARTLRSFFTAIGAEIKRIDPRHLIEAGLIGEGQCGTYGQDLAEVASSPGVNVLSLHDYYGTTPTGGDPGNGVLARLRIGVALNKPTLVGEDGIYAGTNPTCLSYPARAAAMTSKLAAQFNAGVAGELVWNFNLHQTQPCDYDVVPGDPLLGLVSTPPTPVAPPVVTAVTAPATSSHVGTIQGAHLEGLDAVSIDGQRTAFTVESDNLASFVDLGPRGVPVPVVVTSAAGRTRFLWRRPSAPPPCPTTIAGLRIEGPICAAFMLSGGVDGWPGSPESPQRALGAGAVQDFERADIYWSPSTGAHLLREDILAGYLNARGPLAQVGDEGQPLGFPLTNTTPSNNLKGREAVFSGGVILSSNDTPPSILAGAVLATYNRLGATGSLLGFPTSSERNLGGGVRVASFEGGQIYRLKGSTTAVLTGPLTAVYLSRGGPTSNLGLPTASTVVEANGNELDRFTHGSLTYLAATGMVRTTW